MCIDLAKPKGHKRFKRSRTLYRSSNSVSKTGPQRKKVLERLMFDIDAINLKKTALNWFVYEPKNILHLDVGKLERQIIKNKKTHFVSSCKASDSSFILMSYQIVFYLPQINSKLIYNHFKSFLHVSCLLYTLWASMYVLKSPFLPILRFGDSPTLLNWFHFNDLLILKSIKLSNIVSKSISSNLDLFKSNLYNLFVSFFHVSLKWS